MRTYKFYRIEWTDKDKYTHLQYVNTIDQAIALLSDLKRLGYEAKKEIVFITQETTVEIKKA